MLQEFLTSLVLILKLKKIVGLSSSKFCANIDLLLTSEEIFVLNFWRLTFNYYFCELFKNESQLYFIVYIFINRHSLSKRVVIDMVLDQTSH